MAIEFESTAQQTSFYSPLEDFEETTIETTVRRDPLTGRQTRIVPESFVRTEDDPEIESVVEDSEGCFFCPDMVTETTPEYPDFVGFDRGSVGEATSFPNLNPYGAYSNVVVLTEEHYVPLDEFETAVFEDGFEAAMAYVDAVFENDDDAAFASLNMNFLRSAGSSIIHPHLQTLVDDRGTNRQRRRVEAQRRYYRDEGRPFYDDVLDEERDEERYVGETGAVEWYAPFAPQHHYHLRGVVTGDEDIHADAPVLGDLASGLTNALAFFAGEDLNSFNFALHLVPGEEAVRPVMDVIGRSVFDQYYWSDATFFDTIHEEGVIDVAPEEYATTALASF
ncbi:MAG: hypothetical protein ABEJ55_00550 [Halanaeroarchaeum sp.]